MINFFDRIYSKECLDGYKLEIGRIPKLIVDKTDWEAVKRLLISAIEDIDNAITEK